MHHAIRPDGYFGHRQQPAPTGTLTIVNSICTNCLVSGGSIAIGTVNGTGGTLQYSTDGGMNWNAALPTYNQTGPAQTIIASVLSANGCRSGSTSVGQTTPGTCTTPAALTGTLAIVNSICTNCMVSGGSIAIGTVNGTGGTLQYSTDGGMNWSATLPTYNQTGPAQTILASVLAPDGCRSASTQVGQTTPGACVTPSAPTGTLAIVNSTCTNCMVSGGSIAIGSVIGSGGTSQYSTDGGINWSATLPTYNQTGPAQTIIASVLSANGCRSGSTSVPGTCTTPSAPTGTLAIVNSICTNCMVSGGSIAIGTVNGTGGTLQYSTDGGMNWSATLPTYNQTGPAQTIIASVLSANGCRSGSTSVGQTTPGTCTTPAALTGTLAIVNSICTNCMVSGGSIAIGTVNGTGGTLQYSTDGGMNWSATLPTYNQTGPAQTIIASVLSANGCRSGTLGGTNYARHLQHLPPRRVLWPSSTASAPIAWPAGHRNGERHRRHLAIFHRWRNELERHPTDLQPNRPGTDHFGECTGTRRLPQRFHASWTNYARCLCHAIRPDGYFGHRQQHLHQLHGQRWQHCHRNGERHRRHLAIFHRWRNELERRTTDLQPDRPGTRTLPPHSPSIATER
ncbi:MAG: hypothetical protein IPI60_04030 [Saprospiraceae bacterium]|nr:hypothetical protein [Saprospiraceae bacterium]